MVATLALLLLSAGTQETVWIEAEHLQPLRRPAK